jgi:dipeptidyl aminopeptidase/acylaminoacyl peptidase
MKTKGHKKQYILSMIVLLGFLSVLGLRAETTEDAKKGKRPLTIQDIMKFKSINDPLVSEDGMWMVYNAQPDRGYGEVVIYHLTDKKEPFKFISLGKKPKISTDSRWIAALIAPDPKELEKEKKENKEKPETGMALLDTTTGEIFYFEKVKFFAFSENSKWLVYQCFPIKKKKENMTGKEKTLKKDNKKKISVPYYADPRPESYDYNPSVFSVFSVGSIFTVDKWKKKAFPLMLRHLPTGREIHIKNVIYFALDPSNRYLAYSTYNTKGKDNGLFVRHLKKTGAQEKKIHSESRSVYTNLTWSKTKSRLAFLFHRNKKTEDKAKETFLSGLWVWDGIKDKCYSAVSKKKIPKGWMIPAENKLQWSEDGERLFFGFKPYDEYIRTLGDTEEKEKQQKDIDLYNIEQILEKREVDVWHWNDPRIIPHQKKQREKLKKQVYLSIYYFRLNQFVLLADKVMPELQIPENPDAALGFSNRPYLRELTWDGRYRDVYLCYLGSGFRKKILTRHRLQDAVSLSPGGRFVVYYKDKHWHLYNARLKYPRRLTSDIKTPFFNEDHDYPSAVPGYGIAGWTKNDRSVIIYDKYDIWEFFTDSESNRFTCLTRGIGRKNKLIFRIQKMDPEAKFFKRHQTCLLTAYSEEEKYTAFYQGTIGKPGIKKLVQEKKKFQFLKKAKRADKIIYTRESFEEFPDIWISDLHFTSPQKITNVNPQKEELLWGTSELVEWESLDGTRLQGVVIKPENFDIDSARRYPVLVYFYRFFSQRLYEFNPVVINHRPCFPFYASHGYVIFLPDIRFEIGHPGHSAYKCIAPGVHKLIDMGIADPKAIGIHGHSWSGYQTAFIITRTNMFAAAIAGAPVSNMTSAYSGIRWKSGLARQFQYEKSQSRIGKSLWETPDLYIKNSPVFFANRIKTPLLIQFGDKDGAVPWSQGIELYLAMRRLDKNCLFLQYNDEPHHLKKYANKLDYTIKMKEYLDHYLKGKPAPDWITTGIPYKKK